MGLFFHVDNENVIMQDYIICRRRELANNGDNQVRVVVCFPSRPLHWKMVRY